MRNGFLAHRFMREYAFLLHVGAIGNRQLVAALCTATCEDFTAVLGGHARTETVLIDASALRWLVRSFHFWRILDRLI